MTALFGWTCLRYISPFIGPTTERFIWGQWLLESRGQSSSWTFLELYAGVGDRDILAGIRA